MTCPHCRTPLAPDARFCPACGKALSPTESGASWPSAAGSAPDLVGHEIAGRYRIVKKLGEGGMGAVYRGEQISLKRAVAVKLLKPELGSNQMILRRFNAEAEAVAKLSHPNTVNIYDFGQDTDGSLFIAMEFIEGRSLREAIQKEGPFSPTRAISIALQVAASLSDAHAHSIVHRDLKPDNVMLQERGRHKDVVRVLDFGIAKLRDDNRATQQAMTQAGDMLGTPQYMAPEQIRGEAIDGRTDIYALGCMIYEMVTARLPFEAPTIMAMLSKHLLEQPPAPSQRRPDLRIPPALDQLVLRAMAKDAAARPATMDELAEMLQALLATLPADPNRSAGMSVQPGIASAQQGIAPAPQGVVSQHGVATPPSPSSFHGAPVPPAMTPAPYAGPAFTPPGLPPPAGFHPPTTPPAFAPAAAFPPPTAPPPAAAAYGTPPPPPQPPVHAAPGPAAKSRVPLLIALAVLVLGGGGVAVWLATRKPAAAEDKTKHQPDTETPDQPDEHDGSDTPEQPDQWDTPSHPEPSPPSSPDPWAANETSCRPNGRRGSC